MDTDKDSVSEEFLIICKHCEEILPSFRAFLQHKQERHSDTDQGSPKITSAAAEATATGATPTGTRKSQVIVVNLIRHLHFVVHGTRCYSQRSFIHS